MVIFKCNYVLKCVLCVVICDYEGSCKLRWNLIKFFVVWFNVIINDDVLLEKEKFKINGKRDKTLG